MQGWCGKILSAILGVLSMALRALICADLGSKTARGSSASVECLRPHRRISRRPRHLLTGAFFCRKTFTDLCSRLSQIVPVGALVSPPICPPLSGWRPRRSPAPGPFFMQDWYFSGAAPIFSTCPKRSSSAPPIVGTKVPASPDWLHEINALSLQRRHDLCARWSAHL
jgi:hypothetical protein